MFIGFRVPERSESTAEVDFFEDQSPRQNASSSNFNSAYQISDFFEDQNPEPIPIKSSQTKRRPEYQWVCSTESNSIDNSMNHYSNQLDKPRRLGLQFCNIHSLFTQNFDKSFYYFFPIIDYTFQNLRWFFFQK